MSPVLIVPEEMLQQGMGGLFVRDIGKRCSKTLLLVQCHALRSSLAGFSVLVSEAEGALVRVRLFCVVDACRSV